MHSDDVHWLSQSICQIQRQYAEYDRSVRCRPQWSPLAEGEADYRAQQVRAISRMMRRTGRLDLAGLRILDVGCGSGRLLRVMVDMGATPADCVGVEIQPHLVEAAKQRSHPDMQFRVTDGGLPFPSRSAGSSSGGTREDVWRKLVGMC